jgi:hypothetical protein
MTAMSERQRARERFDEIDIRVVWFGFLPSYQFLTLLLILFVAIFGLRGRRWLSAIGPVGDFGRDGIRWRSLSLRAECVFEGGISHHTEELGRRRS